MGSLGCEMGRLGEKGAARVVGGGITGWIDEIRISKGVLPTDAFLRRKTLGLVILFK